MNPTMPSTPLNGLGFKGERDYLHGTDILPAAIHAAAAGQADTLITDIDITFHSLIHTGLTLQVDTLGTSKPDVSLKCRVDGAARKFRLVQDGRPITDRHPYPEEQIVDTTIIDTDTAVAINRAALPFTNIERWIAMIKALHHASFPSASGKWLFARARLSHYRESYPTAVEHRAVIQSGFGGRMTRSALTVDDQPLGDIFFVLT